LNHSAVIAAVLGKPEELKDLSSTFEMHGAAFLAEREGSDPDRYEAVLAKGQAEVGMADNVKEKFSIASSVNELITGQGTQRNACRAPPHGPGRLRGTLRQNHLGILPGAHHPVWRRIFAEGHLGIRGALSSERNHQGLGNRLIVEEEPHARNEGAIQCRCLRKKSAQG